ncbi:MAG: MFS transporter [Chloroflexi bacterium]|nr:MFS transporter [Chloroflexota bacterium]
MPAAAAAPIPAGLWSPERRGLTLGLVLTITLVAAEALAVPTAMPIVARDLGGLELYGLVFSGFSVGALLGIVVVGALIDREGVVRPFVGGLLLFALGLTIGGLAPSMPVLIGARFIQGIGGGAIPPVAYVAIGRALPESLRPRMFAYLSTAWVLPGIFGPAIAGFVAQELHWRLVFLGLLPLIALPGALATRALVVLHEAHPPRGSDRSLRARAAEGLAIAIGVTLLTVALETDQPLLTAGLGAAGLVVTLLLFRRLTPPGTLTLAPGYPSAVLLRGVLTFAFFAVDAYVALLLVEVRGWTATAAGIALTAATVSWTAGSWVQARLSVRYRPERFVRIGFVIVTIGIAGLGLILDPAVPAELTVPIFGIAGFGMGLTYSQFALIVLRDVPGRGQGAVTSALTLSDTIGTALGLGVSAAIVAASYRATAGPGPGIGGAIALGALVAALGFVMSFRLGGGTPRDAATSRGAAGALG